MITLTGDPSWDQFVLEMISDFASYISELNIIDNELSNSLLW